jgi:hypothetical protein
VVDIVVNIVVEVKIHFKSFDFRDANKSNARDILTY